MFISSTTQSIKKCKVGPFKEEIFVFPRSEWDWNPSLVKWQKPVYLSEKIFP